jgi:hypothetical protein
MMTAAEKSPNFFLTEQKIRKAKKPDLATAGAVFWLSEFSKTDWNKIV